MNRDEFESRILELWMRTRIPLTRAHLQYDTGVRRRQLEKWLDEMVVEGTLEVEVGDDGELFWGVPGAARAVDGPETFAALEKKEKMRAGARNKVRQRASGKRDQGEDLMLATKALSIAGKAQSSLEEQKKGKKSLLLSAGVSLLGPLGWLYAAPFRESIPAIAALMLLWTIFPSFLLTPILFLVLPLSSVAGLVYAWQYNRYGKRTPIFLSDGDEEQKNKS